MTGLALPDMDQSISDRLVLKAIRDHVKGHYDRVLLQTLDRLKDDSEIRYPIDHFEPP